MQLRRRDLDYYLKSITTIRKSNRKPSTRPVGAGGGGGEPVTCDKKEKQKWIWNIRFPLFAQWGWCVLHI